MTNRQFVSISAFVAGLGDVHVDVQFSCRLYTCVLVLDVMRILPVALVIVYVLYERSWLCICVRQPKQLTYKE